MAELNHLDYSQKGRCISCGFLARKALPVKASMRGHYEVDVGQRETRLAPADIELITPQSGVERARIVCYLRAPDFPTGLPSDLPLKEELEKPRDCESWCKYIPDLSPKDHLMERRLERLEEDRRNFQVALDSSKHWLAYAALILGAFQVLTMTPDSLLYKMFIDVYRVLLALGSK